MGYIETNCVCGAIWNNTLQMAIYIHSNLCKLHFLEKGVRTWKKKVLFSSQSNVVSKTAKREFGAKWMQVENENLNFINKELVRNYK